MKRAHVSAPLRHVDFRPTPIGWREPRPSLTVSTLKHIVRAYQALRECWRADMLLWRAMARGQRRYCPDVFGGHSVYTEDELRELGATERTVATVEPEAKPAPAIAPEVVAAFDALRWNQAARAMWLGRHGGLPVEKQMLLLASEKGTADVPAQIPPPAPTAPVAPEPVGEPAPTTPPVQQDLTEF